MFLLYLAQLFFLSFPLSLLLNLLLLLFSLMCVSISLIQYQYTATTTVAALFVSAIQTKKHKHNKTASSHFYYYYHQLSLISLLLFTLLHFIASKKNKKAFTRELIAKLNWEKEEELKKNYAYNNKALDDSEACEKKNRNSNRRGITAHFQQ